MKKTCTKCLRELSLKDFRLRKSKHRANSFYSSNCKECERAYNREYSKTYTPDKSKRRISNRKYVDKFPERRNATLIKYRENNKENIREAGQRHRVKHWEELKVKKQFQNQKRQARKKNLECNFDKYDWQRCTDHFDNSCAYCGSEGKLTQDHFIALKHGGSYTRDNIVPACSRCNESKNARNVFVWYPEQKFCTQERFDKITDYLGFDPKARNTQLKLVI